jgi:hypothetical protein
VLNSSLLQDLFRKYYSPGLSSKIFLLTIIIICVNVILSSAQPFGPQNLLSSGQSGPPQDLAVADVDNDGLADVMVSGTPGIVWYRCLGESNFAFQETLVPDFPGAEFEPGDFNGDGLTDLVFAHGSLNYLCWSENEGNGNFKPYVTINNVAYDPRYLFSCDLDMDGDEDIIVSFSPHDRSCWYENDGLANFNLRELNAPYHEGIVRGIWDKDRDGDPDLVIQNINHIQWLENNGQGVFTFLHTITAESNSWFFTTGDIDSDEDDDLVIYNGDSDELYWFENQNNPFLNITHLINNYYSLNTVSCSDVDLDGDMDLLTGSMDIYGITLIENTGDGVFTSGMMLDDEDGITKIISGDFNDDGLPDFVNLCYLTNRVTWYANNGNLSFDGPRRLTSVTEGPSSILAADLDLDGDPDIVTKANGNELDWFQNIGIQLFDDINILNDYVAGNYGYPCGTDVVCSDFDNDGDQDLAVGGFYNYVLLNDGTGLFDQVQKLEYGLEPQDMCLEDLNMDGFQDILLSSYSAIQWYKNLGNGQFSPRIMIHSFAWYGISVCTGDIDHNGIPDLVYASADYNYIAYRYNDGLGNFGEVHYIYPTSLNPGSLKSADLDLDGDNDIVATLEDDYTSKLVWYANLGNNEWSEEKIITEGSFRYSPVLIDLDSDGDEDILSTDIISMASSRIIWCENTGGGVFNEPEIITEDLIWASGVFASDIDADGDLDVLSSSTGDGKIAWYENLRNGLSSGHPISNKNFLQIFPCPAKDNVFISSSTSEILSITISDLSGRLITSWENTNGEPTVRLAIPPNINGVCVLKVLLKDGFSKAEKVILF